MGLEREAPRTCNSIMMCYSFYSKEKTRDPWVAQQLSACLPLTQGVILESRVGLQRWSLLLPLLVSLSLSVSLMNK